MYTTGLSATVTRKDGHHPIIFMQCGFFVLRFLAEDVGTKLDVVLDAILRTLSHRGA